MTIISTKKAACRSHREQRIEEFAFHSLDLLAGGGVAQTTEKIGVAAPLNYFLHFQPKNRVSSPRTT
jgi:hypothetical protein